MAFNWRKFPWTNLHDLNLDWIIQTVKTLEENLADALARVQTIVDTAITKTLTGSGDLTINKTGDVNITGKNVRVTCDSGAQMIGGALMSASAEQLVMHNPNSKTSMSANYNNGVLTLTNNQQLANGVAVYPINTPADGGGDNSTFAANVGYVKGAVNAVDSKLDTEITNRTSGDAALQSTIDTVIMPLINAQGVRDFHVTGDASQDGYISAVTFKDGYPKSDLDNLITQGAKIRLVVDHDAMSDYFNLSYSTENGYCGFSGTLLVTQSNTVAGQVIVYNGTNFTVYGNNAT